MITELLIGIIALLVVTDLFIIIFFCKYVRLKNQKENEYYTDYLHNNLVLRVFKAEFEFQAVSSLRVTKILDRGNLNMYYLWVLPRCLVLLHNMQNVQKVLRMNFVNSLELPKILLPNIFRSIPKYRRKLLIYLLSALLNCIVEMTTWKE